MAQKDPFSHAAFETALNKGGNFELDFHGPNAGIRQSRQVLSPGREASVKKAAAASVQKREINAKGKRGQPNLLDIASALKAR